MLTAYGIRRLSPRDAADVRVHYDVCPETLAIEWCVVVNGQPMPTPLCGTIRPVEGKGARDDRQTYRAWDLGDQIAAVSVLRPLLGNQLEDFLTRATAIGTWARWLDANNDYVRGLRECALRVRPQDSDPAKSPGWLDYDGAVGPWRDAIVERRIHIERMERAIAERTARPALGGPRGHGL